MPIKTKEKKKQFSAKNKLEMNATNKKKKLEIQISNKDRKKKADKFLYVKKKEKNNGEKKFRLKKPTHTLMNVSNEKDGRDIVCAIIIRTIQIFNDLFQSRTSVLEVLNLHAFRHPLYVILITRRRRRRFNMNIGRNEYVYTSPYYIDFMAFVRCSFFHFIYLLLLQNTKFLKKCRIIMRTFA